jgi:hypothetical protein
MIETRADTAQAERGLPIGAAWMTIAILTPVIAAFFARTMAIDLAYQIRAGNEMLASHRLLEVDTFTYTVNGAAWLNQQWGAQVILATTFRLGGWEAIAIVRGLLLAAVLWFLYASCRAFGVTARTAALLTIAGWLIGIEIMPQLRPQEFGFALFAMCLWALATRRGHPLRVWLVPAAMLPWANIHGSFPLGLLLLGFAWLEDRRDHPSSARQLVLAGIAGLAATFVNPFGVRAWSYVVDLSTHPIVSRRIAEWGPPSIHTWTGRFFFASLLAIAAWLARRSASTDWLKLLELGVFAVLSLLAIRGVVWWALVAPVIVASLLGPAKSDRYDQRSVLNVAIVVALVALLLLSLPVRRGEDPVSGGPAVLSYAPETLVAAARDAVPAGAHAFVSQLYASWSEFSAPDLLVAVDSRIEIFPEDVWDDYYLVSAGREGWEDVLDRWDVQVLVLQPDQAEGLLDVLATDPKWEPLLHTDQGSVFVRSEAIPVSVSR